MLPDCVLWMCRPTGPSAVDLQLYDDAAASFERGTDAYSRQEYAGALAAFTAAAVAEPRNPLVQAWRSRTARLARQDTQAVNAADEAVRLLTTQTSARDRLFVEGVAAEAQKDFTTAEARYSQLVEVAGGEPEMDGHRRIMPPVPRIGGSPGGGLGSNFFPAGPRMTCGTLTVMTHSPTGAFPTS